ncbi:MAG TPA: RICIN domain-containing protein, partial [Pseudonocardiaceae bacterium]|nr:RICIN domain-containing protein [Pseudonocardiaceae bacterium]
VEGHEYTETITDQNLGGGWYGTNLGDEIGDRCAWIAPGTPGGMADLSLATGAFAVQSMWANDANGGAGACDISHPAVTNPPATGPVFGIYGKCVDVRGGSPAPQTPVQIFTCNGTPAQRWTVTPGATGDTLQALGQCLDVKGAGTANNTPVRIFTCNSTPAQVWVPLDGELINPNSGRCLDDPSGSSTNGTQLQIYDCHQSDNQAWELPS